MDEGSRQQGDLDSRAEPTAVLARFARDADAARQALGDIALSFEERRKCRLLKRSSTGHLVLVRIVRGHTLSEGDRLVTDDGEAFVTVSRADEELSDVSIAEPLALCRAAYHLGNRHVPLQISHQRLRYPADPVLDALMKRLGHEPRRCLSPFEPEPGAYDDGHHAH